MENLRNLKLYKTLLYYALFSYIYRSPHSWAWPFHDNLRSSFATTSSKSTLSTNETLSKPFGLKISVQNPKNETVIQHQVGLDSDNDDIRSDGHFFEEVEVDNSLLGPEISWCIENDIFRGHICLLIKDHPRCSYDFDNETDIYFELQVQGQFKRKPSGPIYIGLEIPKKNELKLSWPVKTFLNLAMAFMKSWGYKLVHLSLGKEGVHEPQISSPAFQAFDRVIITPIDKEPPPLGHPIPYDDDTAMRRKSFKFDHKICTNSIYTMSLNHTYVDLVEWRATKIPFVKSFHFNFTESVRLTMYEIDEGEGEDTDGHVEAIARSNLHRKRDVVFWIKFTKVN